MENLDYKGARILIVDDVEEIIAGTKNMLTYEGMEVTGITNPIEAIEYLKKNKVDVILLDYFMPEMTGEEFVEELRKFDNDSIIILQTGYAEKLPPLELIDRINIQGYFDKNKGIEDLLLLVKSAIKTSKLLKKVDMLTYKEEFMGNVVTDATDKLTDNIFCIGANIRVMEQNSDKEEFEKLKNNIIRYVEEENEVLEALTFSNGGSRLIEEIFNIVNILTNFKRTKNHVKLTMTSENKILFVNEYSNFLIFAIIEIVNYLIKNSEKDIKITVQVTDKSVNLLVDNVFEYESNFINKLRSIVSKDEKSVKITTVASKLIIEIFEIVSNNSHMTIVDKDLMI